MKKKILVSVLMVLSVIVLLIRCGKKVECDFCGETKKGETKTVFGEEISMCNDCIDELNEF